MSTQMGIKIIAWLLPWLILTGCISQEPILIGFAGELTGRRGEIGVSERDGAQLAVDIINQQGGINGRPLKLIVKDDKGDPDTARSVDAELAGQGVVAIIGHVTSGQTAAVFEQINRTGTILLSPTTSSTEFSGQQDYFFRVAPSAAELGRSLAKHIATQNIKQITGVYDLGNQSYTESIWQALQSEFEKSGGDASQDFTFISGETDLEALVEKIGGTNPEAVVFIASAVDTALMSQYIRTKGGINPKLFAVPWAHTNELLEKGGRAIEGMALSSLYHPQNSSTNYRDFAKNFKDRYNRDPQFGSIYAYESVLVLAHALAQTGGQAAGLPDALANLNNFEGVQSAISIDSYGDAKREIYIVEVRENQFVIIDIIPPN